MQFHPTTLNHPQLRGFLLTEALRGAGATLKNHLGQRFMYRYDDRLELAPRDVVARAIQREIQALDTWCAYLDCTHLDHQLLQHEFPTIYQKLRELNIKVEQEWIPIVPAQHYSCGGIVTDLNAKTNIPSLYASGEVTCTGVHGANRLASNSLLEAIVFSMSGAIAAKDEPPISINPQEINLSQPTSVPENDAVRLRHRIQHINSQHLGIFRTTLGLQEAQTEIESINQEFKSLPKAPFSAYAQEAENLAITSKLLVQAALNRKENVGLHYNADLET